MIELAPKLPGFWAFRYLGRPRLLPINVVVSVTAQCNSRCGTCNIWNQGVPNCTGPELTLDEYERIFTSLGHSPYYLTFSGGEPFLRRDLPEIVRAGVERCRPAVITIPTNGLLTTRIADAVARMLDENPHTELVINLSVDALDEQHDRIRGVPGSFEKAMETYRLLRALTQPNLTLGVHTVVSKFNVTDLPTIADALRKLRPDSYITEVAEERVELGTLETGITPVPDEYEAAMHYLLRDLQESQAQGFASVTQAFRKQYYQLAARTLRERRQIIGCYAGWASGHIAPNGDVWGCCTRAEPLGNLRQAGYDFGAVWRGSAAERFRRSVRAGECACPMANAAYTSMLHNPVMLMRVVTGIARGKLTGRQA